MECLERSGGCVVGFEPSHKKTRFSGVFVSCRAARVILNKSDRYESKYKWYRTYPEPWYGNFTLIAVSAELGRVMFIKNRFIENYI